MTPKSPIEQLAGVGQKIATRLHYLGIFTIQDLLEYYPFRYEDLSNTAPIVDLQEGDVVTIRVIIEIIENKRSFRKRVSVTHAVVSDGTEQLRVVWFNQPFIAKNLKNGDEVFLSGKITQDALGLVMKSPAYEKQKKSGMQTNTGRIVPLYHLTTGITHKQLRYLIEQVVPLTESIHDWVPKEIQTRAAVIPLGQAMHDIHFPASDEARKKAEQRLKFNELFLLQLRGEAIRQSVARSQSLPLVFKESQIKEFVDDLAFTLTKDQKIATWQIIQDMEKHEPMNRLLEGDVGSGKTVVAAIAAYSALLNGAQTAIMAPTEILAKQHFASLSALLSHHGPVLLLTQGSVEIAGAEALNGSKKHIRTQAITALQEGRVAVVIGTHALLTPDVACKKLGLVIVDEQHRFGVEQRKIIKEKAGTPGLTPHFLSMSATPIPRSFALTLYGDLDVSVIKEMPAGRKPVMTRLVDPHNRAKAYDFIRKQVQEGRQAFVVCPMIDGVASGSAGDKKTVVAEYEKLSTQVFPDLTISYVHGKMKTEEKDAVMHDFAQGKTNILVSTTVIEVGVNIPNASVMVVEGADRFGLAQLHQLRGRVGRSDVQSYCFVFTDSDSSDVLARLEFFQKHTDGFMVAEYDLEMRGPGEVYGSAQSGMGQMRLATLKDKEIITLARACARDMDFAAYPELQQKIAQWEQEVHLE